mgnify:CR=1 FL=1
MRIDLAKWGRALCYPRPSEAELQARLRQLEELGVEELVERGRAVIDGVRVLGKGCVGIVIEAVVKGVRAVLKARRIDADRDSMKHEAKLLSLANQLGVGPRLLGYTKDFLAMELVEGELLVEWLSEVSEPSEARSVLVSLLTQCFKLDAAGLDHGELSRAGRHVIVSPSGPVIVDFESASLTRRPRNLTAITQYLVVRSGAWPKLAKLLGVEAGRVEVIEALRQYKQSPDEAEFRKVLGALGLA